MGEKRAGRLARSAGGEHRCSRAAPGPDAVNATPLLSVDAASSSHQKILLITLLIP
jgi:hypothetical protein